MTVNHLWAQIIWHNIKLRFGKCMTIYLRLIRLVRKDRLHQEVRLALWYISRTNVYGNPIVWTDHEVSTACQLLIPAFTSQCFLSWWRLTRRLGRYLTMDLTVPRGYLPSTAPHCVRHTECTQLSYFNLCRVIKIYGNIYAWNFSTIFQNVYANMGTTRTCACLHTSINAFIHLYVI